MGSETKRPMLDDYTHLGYVRDEEGKLIRIRTGRFRFLRTTDTDSPEEKAQRTARYIEWLHTAEGAAKSGDVITLKRIADEVRNAIGEIPSLIPRDGYPDIDLVDYPQPLTFEEIRDRLLADIERRGLREWYTTGEAIRKAGIQ